jgi:hypothetical protein
MPRLVNRVRNNWKSSIGWLASAIKVAKPSIKLWVVGKLAIATSRSFAGS